MLFNKARFVVSGVTSGLILGFKGYDAGLLFTGVHHYVTYAAQLTWSGAGYV